MRENWDEIVATFPDSVVPRMVGSCSALDTEDMQAEVEQFFATHKVKEGDMAVAQMLERLSVNVGLRLEETPRLAAYFASNSAA